MKITNKTNVALVSTFLIAAFAVVSLNVAAAQEKSIEDYIAELNALQATLATLESSTATTPTTTVAGAVSNAACPFTWSRNLTIGSTGNDVRQLQRFLNGNPQTRVATSGVGSPSNESAYYGPATARAVSKFQELHAAQILTPLGLTSGTGGFYTSTRNQANNVCKGSSTVNVGSTTPNTYSPVDTTRRVAVSGDSINVSAGRQPGDSQAVKGAQRVPFTTFVISTGSDSVVIEGIKVRRFGLSSSDNLSEVALVDTNGIQVGSARSLNSRDEANLGGNLRIPRNSSVTLIAVANISDEDTDINSGSVLGLEIVEVAADVDVSGSFPIKGAAHVITESIDLQAVDIDIDALDSTVDFDEDTEITSVEISLDGSNGADEEDAYLRSITLEQTGSADEEEVGDVSIYLDGDSVDSSVSVDGDRYIITFGGRGYEIEEGDRVDLTIEVNTDTGTGETIKFELDEPSDVYVVGADFGFGLPIKLDANGDVTDDGSTDTAAEIQSGDISDGGSVNDFEDEIAYGDDRVIGALEVEFEGEDIEIEDLEFNFRLKINSDHYTDGDNNAWETAGESRIELRNIHLRVDGERVSYADDDVSFDEPSGTGNIDVDQTFSDNFTVDVRGEREVIFEVVANLDEAWSNFDGATLEVSLIDVDKADGVRSDKDYTGNGEFFGDLSSDVSDNDNIDFESVEIVGNVVDFKLTSNNINEDSYVAGTDNVVFGTLEIDASEAVDDIEIDDAYLTFTLGQGDLSHVQDCIARDSDKDEVADTRGDLAGATAADTDVFKFRFNGFEVEAGEEVEVDIVCNIDDDAANDDNYTLSLETANDIEYKVGRDDYTFNADSSRSADTIAVTAGGTLDITIDSPDDSLFAVATGSNGADGVKVIDIEFEAESEDIRITDFYLTGIALGNGTLSATEVGRVIDGVELQLEIDDRTKTKTADDADFSTSENISINGTSTSVTNLIHFEGVNEVIEAGDLVNARVFIDFNGISDGTNSGKSGQYLTIGGILVESEGVDTDTELDEQITSTKIADAIPFASIPTIQTESNSVNGLENEDDLELYEFTVTADDKGDIWLSQIALDITAAGVTLANVRLVRDGDLNSELLPEVASFTAGNGKKFAFTESERIRKGRSQTFTLVADVSDVDADETIRVELSDDSKGSSTIGAENAAAIAAGNFVWSPNGLNNDGATTTNADWFNGWSVFDSSDTDAWNFDEDN